MAERDRLGQTRRRPAPEAHDGVGARLGDRGPGPLGELDRHVLDDLVPLARHGVARASGDCRRSPWPSRHDEEHPAPIEPGDLVADLGDSARPEDGAPGQRLVDERRRSCRLQRSERGQLVRRGRPVSPTAPATRSGQPVAATACSTVTPAWSSVSTSSPLSGSGRRMPRSVMTRLGPAAPQAEPLSRRPGRRRSRPRCGSRTARRRRGRLPQHDDHLARRTPRSRARPRRRATASSGAP